MAKDIRYLKNLSVPYQITDEKYTDVGSGELTLGDQKRAFKGSTDFVVRTASGGGGTLLVEGTDYNLINSDSALTTEAGYTVYTGWQVINATYQSGDLYVTYKTVGTYTGASIINSIIDGWIDINDTLAYASATTINTVYDLTGILEPGMKLKITQPTDGDKYFIIYAITSSLITVTLGDYDLDNEAITNPMFSHSETPFGWPVDDPSDGWEVIDDTLSYASATTITTASDLTGFIEAGMKLKITQPTDGTKYFTILVITSSLITINTDTYDLDNEAITSPYYSMAETPFGWPIDDPAGGWEVIDDTLSYASATTITTASDLTGIIEPGMKLKITQPTDGVKYFVIMAITASLITIDAGDTYDLDNEAITSPYYSMVDQPYGFPQEYDWTPVFTNLTIGNGTLTGQYRIERGMLHGYFSLTLGSTSSVAGSPVTLDPPIDPILPNDSHISDLALYDATGQKYQGVLVWDGTDLLLKRLDTGSANLFAGTVYSTQPFTWTTSDKIIANFSYPVL